IEFAHSRGFVHRDLKPANIMLGDYGEVYVLDWGIARVLGEADDVVSLTPPTDGTSTGELTEASALLGTPAYTAPEPLRARSIDGRADVSGRGEILFELPAGEPWLPRGRAALDAAPEPPAARPSSRAPARDIPPELDELCAAATHADPAARPSARGLAHPVEAH